MRQIAREKSISSLVITMCHLEMSHKPVPQQRTGPVNRDTTEGTKELKVLDMCEQLAQF